VLAPGTTNHYSVAKADAPQSSQASTPAENWPSPINPTHEEAALLTLINQDRAVNGLPPCSLDLDLTAIAREHSKDMCDRHYFDHLSPAPDAQSPMGRYLSYIGFRPNYAMVGENIYYCSATEDFAQTSAQAETAFMNSPGHRANILRPQYTKAGIGFYRAPTGQFWVTQMFLRDTQ
jgi:uncharacterized protein YkwD